MKFLPCELIQDVLPLYHDNVCSETSRKLVDSHLETCEKCTQVLKGMAVDIEMPKLQADEAKPLKSIKRKWNKKTWLLGLTIGLTAFFIWFQLTQNANVKIAPEEIVITNVTEFSNGMYYLEYRIPYDFRGVCADLQRTEDGAVYFQEYRPVLARKDAEKGMLRDNLIDPANHRTDMGTEIPMTAFYLGTPGGEDNVLLWSAEEEYPLATPEMEREHLYRHVFR